MRVNFAVSKRAPDGDMRIRHGHVEVADAATTEEITSAVKAVAGSFPGWLLLGHFRDAGPCTCGKERGQWNPISGKCDRCGYTARERMVEDDGATVRA